MKRVRCELWYYHPDKEYPDDYEETGEMVEVSVPQGEAEENELLEKLPDELLVSFSFAYDPVPCQHPSLGIGYIDYATDPPACYFLKPRRTSP